MIRMIYILPLLVLLSLSCMICVFVFLILMSQTEQIISRPWSTALGFGEERVVIEKDAERVVMRKGTGETVVCGESQGRLSVQHL